MVLQYLAHSFLIPHCEVERELEWQAIEEMRHMGWLAEEMEGLGARPAMVHDPLVLPEKTTDMLEADIAIEQEVIKTYLQQASEVGDPGPVKLLNRIAGEEDHHVHVFGELLNVAREAEAAAPTMKETPAPVPAKKEPSAAGKPQFTVGSLLDK